MKNRQRMAVKKPVQQQGTQKAKAAATPAKRGEGRLPKSTSSAEPVSIPRGENNTGGEKNTPVVELTYGAGNEYKAYDLHPEWDRYVIVEVLWIDAVANAITEWMDIDDLQEVQPCETLSVGYLITDHPEWLTIIALMNDSTGGHAITIPRGMVLTVRALHR